MLLDRVTGSKLKVFYYVMELADDGSESRLQPATVEEAATRGMWQAKLEDLKRDWPDPYEMARLQVRVGDTNEALNLSFSWPYLNPKRDRSRLLTWN